MKKIITSSMLAVLVLFLASCASFPPDKAYPGDVRPDMELAIFSTLDSDTRLSLHKIDGNLVDLNTYKNSTIWEIFVEPGKHTYELSFWDKWDGRGVKKITFTSVAGKRYSLDGKTLKVMIVEGGKQIEVPTQIEDIPYFAEPAGEYAVLEYGGGFRKSFMLYRIDNKAGHGSMSDNAKFNVGLADGGFTVKVTPGTHIIEYKATLDGWSSGSLKPKRSSQIKVESGKTYTLSVVQGSDGEPVVVANEKK